MRIYLKIIFFLISLLSVSSYVFALVAVDTISSISANQPSTLTVLHKTSGTDRFMLVGVSIDHDGKEPDDNKLLVPEYIDAIPKDQ